MGAKPLVKVESQPTSGQRTGDWQVRVGAKTIDRHRKKSVALKRAREYARARGGQVREQLADGTWRTVVSY